jgi:hypothetical protein
MPDNPVVPFSLPWVPAWPPPAALPANILAGYGSPIQSGMTISQLTNQTGLREGDRGQTATPIFWTWAVRKS